MTITLTSCVDQELSEMVNSKSSPDLTHKRTVKQTERLISMAYSIYDNNQYYLDVAKVNGLNSFRRVATGTDVFFPPLEKTTKNA